MRETLATLRRWRRRGGVTQAVTAADVSALEEPEARAIYRRRYITDPSFDQLPVEVQPFVVDTGVHFGPGAATRQLQKAVGATVDGVVGPKTLLAVELAVAVGGGLLVVLVRIRLDAYARQIRRSVTNHDGELRRLIERATSLDELRLSTAAIRTVGRATKLRFIRGWIARCRRSRLEDIRVRPAGALSRTRSQGLAENWRSRIQGQRLSL